MAHVQIEQTVFDFAIREINALEQRIIVAEDDADAMLWEQARQVVEQLDRGWTQDQLAAQWINVRHRDKDGHPQPYSQKHVSRVRQIFQTFKSKDPRPRFRDVFNELCNAGPVNRINFNSGDNEWYTPPALMEAARSVLGAIDLDPSSCALANTVVKAKQYYDKDADGLQYPWSGTVWMNPPYDQPAITDFSRKFAGHVRAGEITAGMVFVNNGTETEWFQTVADVSTAICFPSTRMPRWSPDRKMTSPLQGCAVLYTGPDRAAFCRRFASIGIVLVKADA
jgi:hypothetical protein